MTGAALARLAWQTLVTPREVAQTLLSLRLSQEAILTALALVVVLNALVIGAMQVAGLTGAAVPVMLGPLPIAALLAAIPSATSSKPCSGGHRPLPGSKTDAAPASTPESGSISRTPTPAAAGF